MRSPRAFRRGGLARHGLLLGLVVWPGCGTETLGFDWVVDVERQCVIEQAVVEVPVGGPNGFARSYFDRDCGDITVGLCDREGNAYLWDGLCGRIPDDWSLAFSPRDCAGWALAVDSDVADDLDLSTSDLPSCDGPPEDGMPAVVR